MDGRSGRSHLGNVGLMASKRRKRTRPTWMRSLLRVAFLIVVSCITLTAVALLAFVRGPLYADHLVERPAQRNHVYAILYSNGYAKIELTYWVEPHLTGKLHPGTRHPSGSSASHRPPNRSKGVYYGIVDVSFSVWIVLVLGLMCLSALFPRWVREWRLNRNKTVNVCMKCGYDLTGNTSGTCPECGRSISEDRAET